MERCLYSNVCIEKDCSCCSLEDHKVRDPKIYKDMDSECQAELAAYQDECHRCGKPLSLSELDMCRGCMMEELDRLDKELDKY